MRFFLLTECVAFSLVSIMVGVRMCALARRTRQLPELLIGISFLSGIGLGYTLYWITQLLPPPPSVAETLLLVVRWAVVVGSVTILYFTWRVFRPQEPWAGVLVGSAMTLVCLRALRVYITGEMSVEQETSNPLYWLGSVAFEASYLWSCWESYLYQRGIRRRFAHGLPADLAVATRVSLWSLGLGAAGLMHVANNVVLVIVWKTTGLSLVDPRTNFIQPTFGLVSAIALWAAFFAPDAWVRALVAKTAPRRA